MPVRLALNLQALDRAADRALGHVAEDLDAALHDQLNNPEWGWPGQTRRKSGGTAGTTRDIVDTGALEDSQQLQQVGKLHWQVTWDAPYAAAVFLGAVFKKRRYSMPARNIAAVALRDFNVAERFAAHWGGG